MASVLVAGDIAPDTVQQVKDRSCDVVGVPVGRGIARPSDEVLPDRPQLGDLFQALSRNPSAVFHFRKEGAEYVHVELPKNDCSGLRIGPRETFFGDLRNVFFAGDGH